MIDRDELARALAYERAGYVRSGRLDRVIAVDEQLAAVGYCVDNAGALQQVDATVRAPRSLDERPRGRRRGGRRDADPTGPGQVTA